MQSSLQSLLCSPLFEAIKSGNRQLVEKLTKHKSALHTVDDDLQSCLHVAITAKQPAMVELLLERGAYVNGLNIFDQAPLHLAVANGDTESVKQLLTKGAEINGYQGTGKTPLQLAVLQENIPMITLLLQYGAFQRDLVLGDKDRHAMNDAIEHVKNLEVVALLLDCARTVEEGVDPFWLSWAVIVQRPEMVEFFITQGFDVNYTEHDGCTPIMYITKRPIHHYKNVAKVLKLLIDAGADINATNMFDDTVLHAAVNQYDAKLVKLLCRNGADIESLNNHDQTPLMSAVDYHAYADVIEMSPAFQLSVVKVVKTLLMFKPNIYPLDPNGWSALDYAVRSDLRAAYILAPRYSDEHLLLVKERHKALANTITSNNHGYCAVIITLAKRAFVRHESNPNFLKVLRFAKAGFFGTCRNPEKYVNLPLDIHLKIAADTVSKDYHCAARFWQFVQKHCEPDQSAPVLPNRR